MILMMMTMMMLMVMMVMMKVMKMMVTTKMMMITLIRHSSESCSSPVSLFFTPPTLSAGDTNKSCHLCLVIVLENLFMIRMIDRWMDMGFRIASYNVVNILINTFHRLVHYLS